MESMRSISTSRRFLHIWERRLSDGFNITTWLINRIEPWKLNKLLSEMCQKQMLIAAYWQRRNQILYTSFLKVGSVFKRNIIRTGCTCAPHGGGVLKCGWQSLILSHPSWARQSRRWWNEITFQLSIPRRLRTQRCIKRLWLQRVIRYFSRIDVTNGFRTTAEQPLVSCTQWIYK